VDDMRFERWLDDELHRELVSYTRSTPSPEASRYHALAERRGPRMFVKSLVAATGTKLLVGGAAVVMAASAVTGTAITGSPSPAAWGQQVHSAVDACKTALGAGMHGIGDCVSDFAHKHADSGPAPSGSTVAKVEGRSDQHPNKGTEGRSDQNHGKGANSTAGDPPATTAPVPNPTSAPATEGNSDSSQGRGGEGKSDASQGNQVSPTTPPSAEGNSDSSPGRGTEGHSDSTPPPTPASPDPAPPVHPVHPAHPVHPTHP
jgi:hypothetical protein